MPMKAQWASESGMLMNNFRERKGNLLQVVIREKEMSERERGTQTLTVLTKPPPSQVMDPDVTLAWSTEPNPPFQTLGDTVYSNSFPIQISFCCVLAKRNPFQHISLSISARR